MDFLCSSILVWVLPITTYRAALILKFKGRALMKSTVFMYSSKTVLSIAGNCFVGSDSLCMQQWINFAPGDTAIMWSTTPVYWLVIMWTPWILILTYLTNHYLSPLWYPLEYKKWHVKLLMYAVILKRDLCSYSVTFISNRHKDNGHVHNVLGFIKLQSLETTIMYSCWQLFHYILIRLQFDVEVHYWTVQEH